MRSIVPPFGPWEPAQPTEVAGLLSAMPCLWWIAGGYAIELAVGQPVRDHGDIDVMVLHQDQLHVQDALHGWEWWASDPPGTLRPWQPASARAWRRARKSAVYVASNLFDVPGRQLRRRFVE